MDVDAIVRAYLVGPPAPATAAARTGYAGPALGQLVGQRVYAMAELPEGYRPQPEAGNQDSGPAVLLTSERGGAVRGTAPIRRPAIRVRCFAADERTARRVYVALVEHLQGASTRRLRSAWERDTGQVNRLPDDRAWPYVETLFDTYII